MYGMTLSFVSMESQGWPIPLAWLVNIKKYSQKILQVLLTLVLMTLPDPRSAAHPCKWMPSQAPSSPCHPSCPSSTAPCPALCFQPTSLTLLTLSRIPFNHSIKSVPTFALCSGPRPLSWTRQESYCSGFPYSSQPLPSLRTIFWSLMSPVVFDDVSRTPSEDSSYCSFHRTPHTLPEL